MIELEIDDKKIEVAEGAMIIEAADAANIYIPRFCYHRKLSIAANCRMCLVQVDKSKKPLPACATPVTAGMKVYTQSTMALDAQRSVMEFLLINHPLDCPICDQGGECELQDLSLGYGNDISRYAEGKRSIVDENLGPLIATEMTRCIQCTRCVRFGTEIAGLRELGATQRGEDLTITTYINKTMRSELSGNIIDLCPVGALTSKPFRFTARAWELKQHPSISPHDCIGSNLFVHTRGYEYNDYRQVMRVVPRENEEINETWLSDRDRFSYQAVGSSQRIITPKIKRESEWIDVDWNTALNFIVEKWRQIIEKEGPEQLAALASPSSTVEEFFLLQKLMRNLGSHNIDHRIRQLDFSQQENFPLYPRLGVLLSDIEQCNTIFIVGSDTRREQPLGCHRIRKAALRGAHIIGLNPIDYDFNFDLTIKKIVPSDEIPRILAGIAKQIALSNKKAIDPYLSTITPSSNEKKIAQALLQKGKGMLILGNHVTQHPQSTLIQALCENIAAGCKMQIGRMTEGANSAGAWLAGMIPHRGAGASVIEKTGLNALDMFDQPLKSYLLLNLEPELDCAKPQQAVNALMNAEFVVMMTPFLTEAQEEYADVILPIAPFYETGGTFINGCDDWQYFDAVTRPLGEAKPAWKIMRVLGNLLNFEGFDYTHLNQLTNELKMLVESIPKTDHALLIEENANQPPLPSLIRLSEWPMYQIDNFVRRATALKEFEENINQAVVRVNSDIAEAYGFQSGEIISVIQKEVVVDLSIVIDDRIVGNYVVIAAGVLETAGFGGNMEEVKLLRGQASD